jgi:hypothetical protein
MAVLARKRANGASGKLVGKLVDAVQRGMEYPCADGRLFGTPAYATDFPGRPLIFFAELRVQQPGRRPCLVASSGKMP